MLRSNAPRKVCILLVGQRRTLIKVNSNSKSSCKEKEANIKREVKANWNDSTHLCTLYPQKEIRRCMHLIWIILDVQDFRETLLLDVKVSCSPYINLVNDDFSLSLTDTQPKLWCYVRGRIGRLWLRILNLEKEVNNGAFVSFFNVFWYLSFLLLLFIWTWTISPPVHVSNKRK